MYADIIIVIFYALLIHYLIFLSKIYAGLQTFNNYSPGTGGFKGFISIIIPFRNEEDIILKNLKSIESLDYPDECFEVLYVNDNSDDDSVVKLRGAVTRKNIKLIDAPQYTGRAAHKKYALNYAIGLSKGDVIITSDADCTYNRNWIKIMTAALGEKTGLVSGPVMFEYDNSLFSRLQALEFMGLITAGAGLIGSRSPAICNAANLAYRKKAFDAAGGYAGQMNLSSGDDELLMQKIDCCTEYTVAFCWNPLAVVKTEANKTLRQFFNQRKRWASKGLFYNKRITTRLVFIFFFYLGLITAALLSFSSPLYLTFLIISLTLKTAAEYFILRFGNRTLFKTDLLRYLPVAELLQIPYIIAASIGGLFGNFSWKNRKVKR